MIISEVQQLIQAGRLLEALEIVLPGLKESRPPQYAWLGYALVAAQTAFKYLALEAAENENLLYPSPEAETVISQVKSYGSGNKEGGRDLPAISLIAVSRTGEERDWLRCFASLSYQRYLNIEVVLLSEAPRSAWGTLPPFVSYIPAPTTSVSKALLITQGIHSARGDIVSVIERPRTTFSDVGLSIIASLFKDHQQLHALQGHRLYADEQYIFKQARLSEPEWSLALLLDPSTLEVPSLLFSWRGVFFRKQTLISLALPLREDTPHASALDAAIKIARSTPIYSAAAPIILDDTPVVAKSFIVSESERADALKLIGDETRHLSAPPPRQAPKLIRPTSTHPTSRALPRVSEALLEAGAAAAPLISIVTPVLNCADYIERCIDSVLSQNYKNLEYIILDGGSTDGTQEIIKRYEKHLSFWRSAPDRGHYFSVQEGFQRSTGDIMSWINADDALTPYSLNLVAILLTAKTGIDWITGQYCIFTETRELERGGTLSFDGKNYYNDGFDEPFIQQEGTFWKRELWNRAGASLDLSLELAGDMELWTRFFSHSKLFTATVPLGIFQRRPGQRSGVFRQRYFQEAHSVIQRISAAGVKPYTDLSEQGSIVPIPCESEG